jgi:hypothetical protein
LEPRYWPLSSCCASRGQSLFFSLTALETTPV